jgi:hypothetical protein
VLWRWYARAPRKFASVFNFVYIPGKGLTTNAIVAQSEGHVRFYGPNAFPMLGAVLAVPFEDPQDIYGRTRKTIETVAVQLDIDLHRLDKEAPPSGKTKKTNTPKFRRQYKILVRKAHEEAARAAQYSTIEDVSPQRQGLGCMLPSSSEEEELFTATEDISDPVNQAVEHIPTIRSSLPKLGYRVWDETSNTLFSEDRGFVAKYFHLWRGPLPTPLTPEGDGLKMIKLSGNNHFHREGGPSQWISVFSSLLETLVKRILIRLSQDHDLLILVRSSRLRAFVHASRSLTWGIRLYKVLTSWYQHLESCGISKRMAKVFVVYVHCPSYVLTFSAGWARTKHLAGSSPSPLCSNLVGSSRVEQLVWADIPRAAIIRHFSLRDLICLSDEHQSVADLLRLHTFKKGLRTAIVASRLKEKNIILDLTSAEAIARVCRQFGICQPSHIKDLVACLVDGWSIACGPTRNDYSIAMAFAGTLNTYAYPSEDIINAFVQGCDEGSEALRF